MNRDQIDDLMRENGIVVVGEAVYALVQLVIEHEREACAKVCDEIGEESDSFTRDILRSTATSIRARGNT